MGTNTLATKSPGDVVSSADPNQYKTSLGGDLVPRNTSGVPTANYGSMGTETYPWARGNITTGYFFCGQVIMFHDFNGTVSPGQGWMKCNGDVVSEANYDALHSAGDWDLYVISSPIDGKNLPAMNSKIPIGVTDTSQSGSVAITYTGNASHQVNLAHTHTVAAHNHNMFTGGGGTNDFTFGAGTTRTYNSGGTLQNLGGHSDYTSNATPATDSQGSATQNIQPHTCEFEFWMRII